MNQPSSIRTMTAEERRALRADCAERLRSPDHRAAATSTLAELAAYEEDETKRRQEEWIHSPEYVIEQIFKIIYILPIVGLGCLFGLLLGPGGGVVAPILAASGLVGYFHYKASRRTPE